MQWKVMYQASFFSVDHRLAKYSSAGITWNNVLITEQKLPATESVSLCQHTSEVLTYNFAGKLTVKTHRLCLLPAVRLHGSHMIENYQGSIPPAMLRVGWQLKRTRLKITMSMIHL